MKRLCVLLALAMTVTSLGAWAQCCPKEAAANDAALEQVILLKLADEQELYGSEIVELLEGHTLYRQMLEGFAAKRTELKAALKAAIEKKDNAAITQSVSALIRLEKDALAAKLEGVLEAEYVLDTEGMGKLFLTVMDLDANKKALACKLCGKPCGEMPPCAGAAASCPSAGACPMGAAAPAAPPADPKAEALAAAKAWVDGLIAEDIEKAMALVADDFKHWEYGNKAGLKAFLDNTNEMGYLDDLEANYENMKLDIEGEEVTLYPVDLSGYFGKVTLELVLKKKDGAWKITELDASGI